MRLLIFFSFTMGFFAFTSAQTVAQDNPPDYGQEEAVNVPEPVRQCIGCHGVDGLGIKGFAPQIAGMSELYIKTQVKRFETGQRTNPSMTAIAESLTGYKLAIAAEYFSKQTPPNTPIEPRGTTTSFSSAAATIVNKGDWSRGIPSCVSCHGSGAKGLGPFPRLAGQESEYLAKQLKEWQLGQRKGDIDNMMANIARRLTSAEIEDISTYLSRQR